MLFYFNIYFDHMRCDSERLAFLFLSLALALALVFFFYFFFLIRIFLSRHRKVSSFQSASSYTTSVTLQLYYSNLYLGTVSFSVICSHSQRVEFFSPRFVNVALCVCLNVALCSPSYALPS